MSILRRSLISTFALLPAACSHQPPASHRIVTRPGTIRHSAAHIIVLRPLHLAPYLQQMTIVRSSQAGHIDALPNDRWAEPLNTMLMTVLVANVAERLPDSQVRADDPLGITPADVAVDVSLQRMDLDGSGTLDLSAEISARTKGRRDVATRGVALSVRPANRSTDALIAAMSVAVGQLADAIADLLSGH